MPANQTKAARPETALKVLLLDVETSPNLAYVWGKYEQNTLGDMLQERKIICYAWNWLGESKIDALALPMFKTYRRDRMDNRELIEALHATLSQADIVVGHNVKQFDAPMCNTDFLAHGMKPPPPYRMVDTLEVLRSKFRLNSNKLDDAGARLGIGRKVQHRGFNMWLGCLNGDAKSWAEMVKYNIGDVALLKRLYMKVRPWMTNHPNMTAPLALEACPGCGSKHLNRSGWIYTRTGKNQRFACRDCGKWSTGKRKWDGWRFS